MASKYHAKRTQVDGIWFASKKEAQRYADLKRFLKAGMISGLIIQPVYRLFVRPFVSRVEGELIEVGKYVADFQYDELHAGRWVKIVEDVKGVKTPLYRLKKKFVEAEYGITIRE